MTLRELITAARIYVDLPPALASGFIGFNDHYKAILGLSPVGEGHGRSYSQIDLRRLVAWRLIGLLTGRNGRNHYETLHREAVELVATSEHGWVVMSDGVASWTSRPRPQVFDVGAVCIPVPDWDRHL